MAEKEEVILEFKVDQKEAFTELEKTKKAIIGIKDEQKQLNKALKDGSITLDEYVDESVRLEANLKRQQSSYNTLQKSVTGVKTQLDKLITSNEKISKDMSKTSQTFKEAADNINIAGVNIGALTSGFTKFVNPLTLVTAGVSALGAAYVASTRGAQDLQKAQDILSASSTVISNKLFTGQGGKFSANSILTALQQFGPTAITATAIKALFSEEIKQVDQLAIALQTLREVELLAAKDAQRQAKEALTTAEQNRRYRDDESKALKDRLAAANDVEGSINQFETSLLNVQNSRLTAAKKINELANNSIESQALVKDIEREIADIQEDAEGKRTEAKAGVLAIEKLITLEIKKQATAEDLRVTGGKKMQFLPGADEEAEVQKQKDFQETINQVTKEMGDQRTEEEKKNQKSLTEWEEIEAGKRVALKQAEDQAKLQSGAIVANALAGLAAEGTDIQRTFALTALAFDTAAALTGGIRASQSVPYPGNLVAMASTIATILGNIAAAKDLIGGAAAGGGDFMTTGPTMLMVGDNPGGRERVTVEPISGKGNTVVYPHSNLVKMAGGGSLTTNSGAGWIEESRLQHSQQLAMENAIKSMARQQIVVAVRDIQKGLADVAVKQNKARIKNS